MNIYLVSQEINDRYDTWDAIVVAAKSEDAAREVKRFDSEDTYFGGWVKLSQKNLLQVELLGVADERVLAGIILASFNAG